MCLASVRHCSLIPTEHTFVPLQGEVWSAFFHSSQQLGMVGDPSLVSHGSFQNVFSSSAALNHNQLLSSSSFFHFVSSYFFSSFLHGPAHPCHQQASRCVQQPRVLPHWLASVSRGWQPEYRKVLSARAHRGPWLPPSWQWHRHKEASGSPALQCLVSLGWHRFDSFFLSFFLLSPLIPFFSFWWCRGRGHRVGRVHSHPRGDFHWFWEDTRRDWAWDG